MKESKKGTIDFQIVYFNMFSFVLFDSRLGNYLFILEIILADLIHLVDEKFSFI